MLRRAFRGSIPVRVPVAVQGGESPLDLPLATTSDITNLLTYQGTHAVPIAFEYGGPAMSVSADGSQLYVQGMSNNGPKIGRMSVPSVGGTATTQVSPVTIAGIADPGINYMTGTLVHGDRLIAAYSIHYDGDTEQTGWCKATDLDVGNQGSVNTMNASNGAYVRRLSQCMGHWPEEWQEIVGGPAYTMGCRMNIIGNAQGGYGLGVFDPADVQSGGGAVDVQVALDYVYPATLDTLTGTNGLGGNDYWGQQPNALCTGFVFPGSSTFVFITSHGYGPLTGIGGAGDLGCRDGSSVHNDPNRLQAVLYRMSDIVDALNGLVGADESLPYGWVVLPDWDTPYGACVGSPGPGAFGGCGVWDPANSRLLLAANGFGGDLEIARWSVGSL